VWSARVGIGKPGTPTPAGRFYAREKLRNTTGDPLYGPWAIGTSAYSQLSEWPGGGVVGIHGTNQPGLIPGRPSHGCVRLTNHDVAELVRRLPTGSPIWVH
jgi:lipoprotein-anchoring transpeptidase ErfK/SrfK